ncbi:MAG: hypothetical protein JO080_11810 [Mucilaginibacter sp.]|nr:hypothetical protein [Mucilaginibacter sp.]
MKEVAEFLFGWVIYIFVFLFGWIVKFGVAGEVVFYIIIGVVLGGGVVWYKSPVGVSVGELIPPALIAVFVISLCAKLYVNLYMSEFNDEAKKYRGRE